MITTTRIILTGALLAVVWHHAHWSVSLSLTLSALSSEMLALMPKKLLLRHETTTPEA